jgi:two-component system chemotaxis sensor kinase CheA
MTMKQGSAELARSLTRALDDAVALSLQLAATGAEELGQVRDALQQMASDTTAYADGVQRLAAAAAQKITSLLQGQSREPQALLRVVGWLLAGAVETRGATTSEASAAPLVPAGVDDELFGEFITECRTHIAHAETALLTLEMHPTEREAINTVLRALHTIKGTSAFLGCTLVTDLVHHAESLLSRMRDQTIPCTGGYADLALRSVDMLKNLIQTLQDTMGGGPVTPPRGFSELMQILQDPDAAGISAAEVSTVTPLRLGDILVAQGKVTRQDVEEAVAAQGQEPLGIALTRAGSVTLSDVGQALRMQRLMASGEAAVESSVRVRVDRLDRLIDLVGQLVIAHTMVIQDDVVGHGAPQVFLKKLTQLGKIVHELQDLSLSMRMVPLKATFQKMTRAGRDVAQKRGKQVHFVTQGEETEIDHHMVGVVAELLVHMVRNAIDHGLESPDMRQQLGKPCAGTVLLAAYHANGHVVIVLQDDGKGLHRHTIVDKAMADGLIVTDAGMSDNEVFHLIFAPGFSTAERLTDISGRGVGMDVVWRGLAALKGRIDITSEVGHGTIFTLYLPLTLAIPDGGSCV